jgi:hypothetical protein
MNIYLFLLFHSGFEGTVRVWTVSLSNLSLTHTFLCEDLLGVTYSGLVCSASGHRIAVFRENRVHVWILQDKTSGRYVKPSAGTENHRQVRKTIGWFVKPSAGTGRFSLYICSWSTTHISYCLFL